MRQAPIGHHWLTASLLALLLSFTASAYEVVEVANGARLEGRVLFEGEDPPPKVFKVTRDNAVCGGSDRPIDFVKVNDGGLGDVVVYLDKVEAGKPYPETIDNPQVDQQRCEFMPYLQIMRNEDRFLAINSDPILHNVHAYELLGRGKRTVFNISQPDIGETTKQIRLRRGSAVKIECDAHDFMHSYLFVARNPYFARVDEQGRYTIDSIPPGSHAVKAWHPTLGTLEQKVDFAAGAGVSHDFTFKGE
jgi:hypothetical protein